MKYLNIALLAGLVIVLAIILAPKAAELIVPDEDAGDMTMEERAEMYGVKIMGSLDPEYGENFTFVDTVGETFSHLKEGEFAFTVTDAKIITNINDLPEGAFDGVLLSFDREDGTIDYYTHPFDPDAEDQGVAKRTGDFVLEDGSFMDGVYAVTVDVRLENRGGVNRVIGEGISYYYDPYLFDGFNLLRLYDLGPRNEIYANMEGTGYLVNVSSRVSQSADYYSEYGSCYDPDAPETKLEGYMKSAYMQAVRVEPGETKDITLGYIVSKSCWDWPMTQPEDLCVLTFNGGVGNVKEAVYLGLTWPKGMEGYE